MQVRRRRPGARPAACAAACSATARERRQQPGAARPRIAADADDQQAGGEQIQGDGDENDCHRTQCRIAALRFRSGTRRVDHAARPNRAPGYTSRPVFARPAGTARMFESLTQRLSGTIERLRGRGRLSEENIREALREVRIALLEADVALPVVQALIERIKVRAVGQEVLKSLTPGQALIKVVRDETDRGDGFAGQRPQPQRAGAGGDPDGRPAGRGQDHDGRQARQAPEGTPQEEGDGGVGRRLPSGRDRAAEDAGAAGRRAVLPVQRRRRSPKPSSAPRSTTRASPSSTC